MHVWGMAAEHENVTVTFRGETKSTIADELGRWSLYLSPGEAGGPFPLTVKAANTIVLNDVLVGDVWVASGQSNMEFSMNVARQRGRRNRRGAVSEDSHFSRRTSAVRLSAVECRCQDMGGLHSGERRGVLRGCVLLCARSHQKINVPIGLVESFWGGTPAESWTSLHGLSADASLMPVFAERSKMVGEHESMLLEQQRRNAIISRRSHRRKPRASRRRSELGIRTLRHGLPPLCTTG